MSHTIAGTYECYADNGILPTASVLIRVDVTCKYWGSDMTEFIPRTFWTSSYHMYSYLY